MAARQAISASLDQQMMRRALQLARKGEGRVEPNPMVGCVICRGERIIGEGYHRRFGGPHAEVNALGSCTSSPRGSTAYVTLEPCAHFGKTPPCVDALLAAGVERVVAAARDPNPLVNGRGLRRLRRSGVKVLVGVEADAGMDLLAPFATLMRENRPYVIAKWAQTADGRLTTDANERRWISSVKSRRRVHLQRARVDAVVVGVNTVIADDPLLTARGVTVRRRCARVVLDRRLRIPVGCTLVATAREHPLIVFTGRAAAASAKSERLRKAGVEIVGLPSSRTGVRLESALRDLGARGFTNVVAEGGFTVLQQFFRAGLIDEACVYVAPGKAGVLPARSSPGMVLARACQTLGYRYVHLSRSGGDTLFHYKFGDPRRLWASR